MWTVLVIVKDASGQRYVKTYTYPSRAVAAATLVTYHSRNIVRKQDTCSYEVYV